MPPTPTPPLKVDDARGRGEGSNDDGGGPPHSLLLLAEESSSPPPPAAPSSEIDSICVGSGRFLRSVLVPALLAAGLKPAILQPRGRTFLDRCLALRSPSRRKRKRDDDDGDDGGSYSTTTLPPLSYEVDTVERDGSVSTDVLGCYGVGTLGTERGRNDAIVMAERMERISAIGVGVTEAGLASPPSSSVVHLVELLRKIHQRFVDGKLKCINPNGKICVVNTDNVPRNGDVVRSRVLEVVEGGRDRNASKKNDDDDDDGDDSAAAKEREKFLTFLQTRVAFLNSMVDRITSSREGTDGFVPRCEPIPKKALVLEDLGCDLPGGMTTDVARDRCGVVVRTKPNELQLDVDLKLRVANGTHTAVAQAMALSSLPLTDVLSSSSSSEEGKLLLSYLDAFFEHQILESMRESHGEKETRDTYDDWRKRLTHPKFGLSTFFIAQNAPAKVGIRIGPTITDLMRQGKTVTAASAFAVASVLRFVTPTSIPNEGSSASGNVVYRGRLDGAPSSSSMSSDENGGDAEDATAVASYADGLRHDLTNGWYEFRCDCVIELPERRSGGRQRQRRLSDALFELSRTTSPQPVDCEDVVRSYLVAPDGGDMFSVATDPSTEGTFRTFASAVSTLLARMISGDSAMGLLREMSDGKGIYASGGFNASVEALVDGVAEARLLTDGVPLHHRPSPIPDDSELMKSATMLGTTGTTTSKSDGTIRSVVYAEVAAAKVVDLHTHLLPPSHGPNLCLWGVDELLTYHYLIAEYFMTAPSSTTPEQFYSLPKQKQADIVWNALFVERTPISEACRGVLTVWNALGLEPSVRDRDLDAIRTFYDRFRKDKDGGAERFSDTVFHKSGVRYAVMTNVPFDSNEARQWRPKRKEYPNQYKSALRVDPLLAGDEVTIERALRGSGYDVTLEGARRYLNDWIDTMKPEYVMASTPHDFALPEEEKGTLSGVRKTGMNEDAMKVPFAFATAGGAAAAADDGCGPSCEEGGGTPSVVNEGSDYLTEVLMKVCEDRDLPVALKIGARRNVNPSLRTAGDGTATFVDPSVLGRLCGRFPKVRFLATFLSRTSQHDACVLANKFRNLHLYGCWWYCNNPSIVREVTTMRVEMLGTGFTAQHSDARVLDQLLYKWPHSRAVIAEVLAKEYEKLAAVGWRTTRGEIRRDVRRLLGGSYEEFMSKSFV